MLQVDFYVYYGNPLSENKKGKKPMSNIRYIQVINFNLEGITHDDFMGVANEVAPNFAVIPGLISKVWLSDEVNNTYGGVYIWESKDAYEGYLKSDLFAGVGANPALANIVSKDFDVIEGPTRVTRGL